MNIFDVNEKKILLLLRAEDLDPAFISGSLNEIREAAEKIPPLVVRPLRGVGVKAGPLRKQNFVLKL